MMGLYQFKEFLTLDDVADYLRDKGVYDFDTQNKHEKKRFKDFIQELELMHGLKRLQLIDGEFDVEYCIWIEKNLYQPVLQLKHYRLLGFFYHIYENKYSQYKIISSHDDCHDEHFYNILEHYTCVSKDIDDRKEQQHIKLPSGIKFDAFGIDFIQNFEFIHDIKVTIQDGYHRIMRFNIEYTLNNLIQKPKYYFLFDNVRQSIDSYLGEFDYEDLGDIPNGLIEAYMQAFLPTLLQNPDFNEKILENPEPPELKVIDFTDDGEQSEFNDSQQQIADLQAKNASLLEHIAELESQLNQANATPAIKHTNQALQALHDVLVTHWQDYDPSQPKTRPKQSHIQSWIVENYPEIEPSKALWIDKIIRHGTHE